MKYVSSLLCLFAACGGEESPEPIQAPVIHWLNVGTVNDDATSYRLGVMTWNTTAWTFTTTDVWSPTAVGPAADATTVVLTPSSGTIRHYFEIRDLAGVLVDQSPMFTFAGGSAVIYCRINGGNVYWSASASGPWN